MFLTWPYKIIPFSERRNYPTKRKILHCSTLMTVRWTVHVTHMYSTSTQHKRHKLNLTAKKYSFLFFLFLFISYNSRLIQEYFQPKIGRKIRIFSLGRKNNILAKKKSVYRTCLRLNWSQYFFWSNLMFSLLMFVLHQDGHKVGCILCLKLATILNGIKRSN